MRFFDLDKWIKEVSDLCQPDSIHFCDGSQQEYDVLCELMINQGTFIRLNPELRPNSFVCRSDPTDVARMEDRTYICSNTEEEAGPTNHWMNPVEMKKKLKHLFHQSMKGRVLYVIPFSMGPIDSPLSVIGVQITDSPYVVCNMQIMTRVNPNILSLIPSKGFIPCLHSVGRPLNQGDKDVPWPCNPEKWIVHFPESREIWSYGSGYGGNALLGKKCLALRIASVIGRDEGWLAEHMLILGITNPEGEKKYFAAAFPSACGKTNLAMLNSRLPGWKVETVGDDIAWMRVGKDGKLYAINPEVGFFGVAPGTSMRSNPNAMLSLQRNAIFTNVALTNSGDIWWEGMTETPPKEAINWLGHSWDSNSKEKAAHPNARFTVSASQCPVIDPNWQNPKGVPIAAILFGGRRHTTMPLVCEAFDWPHGVFLGATLSSETTSASTEVVGQLRHDPFGMLPFCGYHMGEYFKHWLNFGKRYDTRLLPKIYAVNWFKKKKNSSDYLWPGFGENIRVLKWIFQRTSNQAEGVVSPLGYLPTSQSLDQQNLSLTSVEIKELFEVDQATWINETKEINNYFSLFEDRLPIELSDELTKLKKRIGE